MRLMLDRNLPVPEIERWLRETDPDRLSRLWREADEVRLQTVGDEVHLRGLVEISNHCARSCTYCGIRAPNSAVTRYRMTESEIMSCVSEAVEFGYGTVVMQAGEDYGIHADWLAAVVSRIKRETELAVTLSMGERPREDLALWREAGADRYLIRFETSDPELYKLIHPSLARPNWNSRFEILRTLRELGYEAGGGVMIGIPGQSFASLASDIERFRQLDLDMIGVGPYIAHPQTPLGSGELIPETDPLEQVPGTDEMTCKVVALSRIVCPSANIPSTTALATLNKTSGREMGLMRGANVVMPNLTPARYRALYEIYPDKACLNETAEVCQGCLKVRIQALGRDVGTGPGGRRRTPPAD